MMEAVPQTLAAGGGRAGSGKTLHIPKEPLA
jgi:hypothetical protein